jgi:hypothetical protein
LGYFDALFWCGIGYHTQSVSDGCMVFDYPTFQQHFTSLDTAGERYYCNKAAFGPSNADHTIDSAPYTGNLVALQNVPTGYSTMSDIVSQPVEILH